MKPLILNPIYKEKPWGKNEFLQQVKGIKKDYKIGESWEVFVNQNNECSFENSNMNMNYILMNKKVCKKVLGNKYTRYKTFPFFIKTLFIDGEISLQVHPNNKFAKKYENDLGKDEVWYILYADENTYVNIGLRKSLSKKELEKNIRNGEIIKYLRKVKIKAGDIINIPAGTIHSILGKAIIYEVQQNSNITYRIHDNNGRNLDIEKAIHVFKNNSIKIRNREDGRLIKTKHFKINKLKITNQQKFKTNRKFTIITVVAGEGKIISKQEIKIKRGMTILIPAALGSYTILGNLDILETN